MKNKKDFACIKTMLEETEQTFNEKLLARDPNDLAFEVRKYLINIERAENLDVLESMNVKKKYQSINFLILTKKTKMP